MPQDASDQSALSQQQAAGDIAITGNESSTALVTAAGNAAIDQSRHIIYNYYYYREESRPVSPTDDTPADALPCPYRGLFHFGPEDAEFFFGRDVFVAELLKAVQSRALIPVLGASGSGKSSVVLAGLVPKLQQTGHWQFTHFRPGDDPFYALAVALLPLLMPGQSVPAQLTQTDKLITYLKTGNDALKRVMVKIQQHYPQQRVLLIADQFEELYTLCPDEATRCQFLDCLLAGLATAQPKSARLVLVATMRADFLGNALAYRPFADGLQAGDVKLGAMNRAELQQVIEQPATKLGVTFEAGLVQRILEAVESQPGNLPLLEFALTELWGRRNGRQLTHAAYEAIGEVEGALAQYADAQYATLSEREQAEVRRIFVQLVRPGEGTEDTRRLATKAELGEDRWALVTQLADTRLVVTSQDSGQQETVEVVHEALIRNWGELRGWMTADRSFRVWQDRLRGAMQQWQDTQQDEGSLLRGAALAEAEEKLKARPDDLSEAERQFIQRSLDDQERLQQAETARRQREIRTAWSVAGGAIVALLVSSGLGWMAWQQTKQATLNQVQAQGYYADAVFQNQGQLDGIVTAIKAGKLLLPQGATDRVVMQALQNVYHVQEQNRLVGHTDQVMGVSVSADGNTIASASNDKTVKLWNRDGKLLQTLSGHTDQVVGVSVSADGNTIASASRDKTVKLWNRDGTLLQTLSGHTDEVMGVSVSANGQTLASASRDKTVKLWNRDGTLLHTLSGHTDVVVGVSVSADGNTIASASGDQTVKLWSRDGKLLRTLNGHTDVVVGVSVSADGNTIASASSDQTVKLWSRDGKLLQTLSGHTDQVWGVSVSADGNTIASASLDKTVKLWSRDGTLLHTLNGHTDVVVDVSMSADGNTIASASRDQTVKLWSRDGTLLHTLAGHTDVVRSVSVSADGNTIASASSDQTVKLWSRDGTLLHTLNGHTDQVRGVSVSADGNTIASASRDQTVKLWSRDGTLLHTLNGHTDVVVGVSMSADGNTIASASKDQTVKLWSRDGKLLQTLSGHTDQVWGVSVSADGNTIASASNDKTVKLWNLREVLNLDALLRHNCNAIRDYLTNSQDETAVQNRNLCEGV